MRLNKYLADCGVASRRGCDAIIAQGRIKINGKTVTQLGIDVNPDNDTVSLDGKRLKPKRRDVYVMLHKPKGVVCTAKDDKGRKTVLDLLDDCILSADWTMTPKDCCCLRRTVSSPKRLLIRATIFPKLTLSGFSASLRRMKKLLSKRALCWTANRLFPLQSRL